MICARKTTVSNVNLVVLCVKIAVFGLENGG